MTTAISLNSGNTAWLIMATVLVLMMTIPGIALFYGGLVRRKNMLSVIMQSLSIVAVISIIWVVFGYSLAFGSGFDGNLFRYGIGGFDKVMLKGISLDTITTGGIPELLFVMFQCMFAVITPALILGEVLGLPDVHNTVERVRIHADGALGMGRRIPHGDGSHRLRGRYRGAHQRRSVGSCDGSARGTPQ